MNAVSIRNAFVFAAGYGTRLRPYTLETPKPMLEVMGRPLVEWGLLYLRAIGIQHVTVNAAWLAEAFDELPARGRDLGLDVAISRQPEPFEHGGDLAAATEFLDRLGPDESFLALNGDTLCWIDPEQVRRGTEKVNEETPLVLFGHETKSNPLHVCDGKLVAVNAHQYAAGAPDSRYDDFGLKGFHASIRRFLPEPGMPLSLHGSEGLIDRVVAAGGCVQVHPIDAYTRVEIGTVADYEGHRQNNELKALTERLARSAP